jgi:drug/metabolite transporter (DMT)-like permease
MRQYLYAMGAILCWASLPAATGSALDDLSTEELLFYSFTSGALFLYLLDIVRTRSFIVPLPDVKTCLLGVWGIFFYHYMYYLALERAPIAEAAILATTWSFWIVVFSSLIRFRRLKGSIVITSLVCLAGAALVIKSGKTVSFEGRYLWGYILALGCGLVWSSFSIGLALFKPKTEPMTFFMVVAALLSVICFTVTGPYHFPTLQSLAAAVYLGCVPLGLSFFLWNRAVVGGNMTVIGYLSYLTPPLAVLLVALIRQETISGEAIAGMGLIMGAAFAGKKVIDGR